MKNCTKTIPEKFEDIHGIKGIAEDYKIPEKFNNSKECEDYIFDRYVKVNNNKSRISRLKENLGLKKDSREEDLNNDLNELVKLNPKLQSLMNKELDYKRKVDLFIGVCNKFPLRDIEFYISNDVETIVEHNKIIEKKAMGEVGGPRCDSGLCWAATEETVNLIQKKILEKDKKSFNRFNEDNLERY